MQFRKVLTLVLLGLTAIALPLLLKTHDELTRAVVASLADTGKMLVGAGLAMMTQQPIKVTAAEPIFKSEKEGGAAM